MAVSADTLQLLMDAGLEGDDLLRVVRSIQADQGSKPRSANAERQARHRARKREQEEDESVTNNVTSNVTESVTPRAHVETNLKPDIETGKARKKTTREGQAEFEIELSAILDADRVQALVDVRKKRSGTLNAHSARLLIAKIQACGLPPHEAADTMALRNWISIEPAWLGGGSARGGAPPKPQSLGDMFREDARQKGILHDQPPNNPPGRMETRDRDREVSGTGDPRVIALTRNVLGGFR